MSDVKHHKFVLRSVPELRITYRKNVGNKN